MKRKNLLKTIALIAFVFNFTIGWNQVTTFDYTGDIQTYTVPDGVSSIQIECYGAEGTIGAGPAGGTPGLGGLAQGSISVTPGEIYNIYVGGQNGYNGGGAGGIIDAGNGGGASDVRFGGIALGDRIIVGGGGGGGGSTGCADDHAGGNGGAGGGLDGTKGDDSPNGGGGFEGTLGSGGAFGIGCPGFVGFAGSDDGTGGAGQGCCCATTPGGGGGGGGYVVGGGGGGGSAGTVDCSGNDKGGGGGGAGGSSYTGVFADAITDDGVRTGNGQIIITELCAALSVTVTDASICLGESFTVTTEGIGVITWDGGLIEGEPLTPPSSGIYTFEASSDSDEDCGYTLEIIVNDLPVVSGIAVPATVCFGETIVLTGSGADEYAWDPADIEDGAPYTPPVGEFIYLVTGTDLETGCSSIAEVEVVVHELPEVIATASDNEICIGEGVTLTGSGAVSYNWSDDVVDGEEFFPTETGITVYTLTGIDDNGCANSDEAEVTVYDALDITYTITEEILGGDGEIDITVTGGNAPYSFDWDTDELGDFDDDEDLTELIGGTYTVVVMCDAGCTMTETIDVTSQVGIEEDELLDLNVYPNPTSDNLTIQTQGKFTYELTAINGEVVLKGTGANSEEISLEDFAPGIYTLQVASEAGKKTIKIVRE